MRNTISIITLFIFSFVVVAGEPDKKLHDQCIYPTVMIQNKINKHTGSGVILKSIKKEKKFENLAITCSHFLVQPIMLPLPLLMAKDEKKEPIKCIIYIGQYENWSKLSKISQLEGTIVYINRIQDIALIKFETDKVMPVAQIEKKPKLYIGNDVLRVGCGLGEPFRVDYGKVTSLQDSIGKIRPNTIRTSILTVPGDSGGPVYHEYKLIGVAQFIRSLENYQDSESPVFHMSYVIPIDRFLQQEEIAKQLK